MNRLVTTLASAFAVIALLGIAPSALASPITITVGDDDGFGFGAVTVPDNAPVPNINLPEDRRSAAEAAAVDGAQQTDFYSSLFNPLPETVDFLFPFIGTLNSASLTVDMGGFQADVFGQIAASYNGVLQPNLFDFADEAFATNVRVFVLSPAALAAASESALRAWPVGAGRDVRHNTFRFGIVPIANRTPEVDFRREAPENRLPEFACLG